MPWEKRFLHSDSMKGWGGWAGDQQGPELLLQAPHPSSGQAPGSRTHFAHDASSHPPS